ncbi:fatty acid desaturase family protein [Arthrobacter crystallopoietes]|uniref:Linoleoyl-CoA desaturase n=1 Tax=Crystallibacter crystallopoietes TaxID=37928 RepID=A0A1H1AW24_9MICC|nr:acyl-CoA desaturase [Arthrobacter crystallopoietes]AUI51380.1 acyl-CoA desaturase [Arthrobacter crystallopoietes]SDQ43853.1 linoleoyl-CoA desaturase [Arthrobacter crystallopoietes]
MESVSTTATARRTGALAASGHPLVRPPAAAHLSDEQVAELGRELDAIRDEVIAERGASDAAYIRRVIKAQRGLEIAGRAALLAGRNKTAWVTGTTLLSFAKILENMEIGHNVLHGQWDWMRDPDIHSTTWEWDFVTPARSWQHTHNDLHHRWTNVIGKDKDVGYNLLRMSPDQPWRPFNLGNPLWNAILAPVFEWGIAIYDLELVDYREGTKSKAALVRDLKAMGRKALRQFTKDYAATPIVAMVTGSGKQALWGTLAANAVRNVWAHAVIFCGHFPDGADTFTEEMVDGETRGDWYVRQMIGSANISGSKFMHLMTGNLSHQIEHHLFPDLPSNRYIEVAPKVRDICRRYGLPYNSGPLFKQVGSSWAKVFKYALPDKAAPAS